MSDFSSFSPADLSVLASVIAIGLSEGRTPDEVNVLGNLIAAIGASMLTIAAQQQSLASALENKNNP